MANWDKRFMELAEFTSLWSKDKKRKVGAIIVGEDKRVVSLGFNGIPQSCNDDDESRHIKPKKLFYFEHAERNCLYNCLKSGASVKNCTMYITWFACADCARGIIQSGIKRVVCRQPDWNGSWSDTFKASKEMLEESGVEIKILS